MKSAIAPWGPLASLAEIRVLRDESEACGDFETWKLCEEAMREPDGWRACRVLELLEERAADRRAALLARSRRRTATVVDQIPIQRDAFHPDGHRRIWFEGNEKAHSICLDCSDADRVLAHWSGYTGGAS